MSGETHTGMAPQLIMSLSEDVKGTEYVISKARETMMRRKEDTFGYYEPARNLLSSIKRTREEFRKKSSDTLDLIKRETEEMKEIQGLNEAALRELDTTKAELERQSQLVDDSPIMIAVRGIAAMFPFVLFSLVYLSK